jgi:Mrp family chromosome partitioning ATPase/capsular polysaccharide biosynthesis protein
LAATLVLAEATPQLGQYLLFLRRQAWLILLVPAMAFGVAYFLVARQHSVYRASMGILVAQGGGAFQPQLGNQALTQTMTGILRSDVIAQRVVEGLHLPMTSSDLLKKLRVEAKPDSSVLDVSYDSESKQEALKVLTAEGRSFKALVRAKLGVSDNLNKPGPLLIVADVFNPPYLEPHRVSPHPGRVYGFAIGLGLALGVVLAFARQSLDDRVRGRHDAEKWFGAPVIGSLPGSLRNKSGLLGGRHRSEATLDALQLLQANVQLKAAGMGPTILVTSAADHEGKTTVVANLAMALAVAGQDVICVEADLRRPTLHKLLGVSERVTGLVDVLERRTPLEDALREVELVNLSGNGDAPAVRTGFGGGLKLLPAGVPLPDSATLLSQEGMAWITKELSTRASYVIFDSPPLLAAGEVLPLALAVDGVLLVARQGRTTRQDAHALRTALERLGVRKLAVVLTDARPLSVYTPA